MFAEGGDFLPALWFTAKYTFCFVIFSNVFALVLAVMLTKKFKTANFFRGIFFIPYIMSMTIVGFIWKFIFTSGFEKLYEAATVDGAGRGQTFFRVTLPLLGPSFTTCIFMSLTNGLKVFDIILALTKGGPGTASNSVTMQIYKEAFTNNNYGLGSAESIIYFLFVMIVTQLVLKVFSRREVDL